MPKIIFVSIDLEKQLPNSGSRRIRTEWVAPHLEADIYNGTQDLEGYDVIIYHRSLIEPESRHLAEKYKHKLQIFDICDPDHLTRYDKVKYMIDRCRFVTTSNDELSKGLSKYFNKPIYTVPDRMNLDFFKIKKIHKDVRPKIVWFGYSSKFQPVKYWRTDLEETALDLIVISDYPTDFGKFVKYQRSKTLNITK